jgi:hypothetical protein
MLRYNSQTHEFEVFTDYASWGWETLRTRRPNDITFQQIGVGSGDGTVDSIVITNPGSGYTVPPTVTFSPPDVGVDVATATVTIDGTGAIDSFTITNSGSGYMTVPQITVDAPPGGGTQAVLDAVLVGELEYELPVIPVDSMGNLNVYNVQVYVENVFQLPGINFTVVQVGPTAYAKFDAPVPFGKPIYAIFGLDR